MSKSQSLFSKTKNGVLDSGNNKFRQKLLVATPTTGLVRYEWVAARYGMVIPTNWSKTDMIQYLSSFVPLRYTVHDAQNLAVQAAIEGGFQWMMFIEHDTMPNPETMIRLTDYMDSDIAPVVSGLYFTRSNPAEPMVYRGRGNHYNTDWKLGDKVWVDGVPTGMLLLSMKLMKAVWDDSPEYRTYDGQRARRVFDTPAKSWFNEETGAQETLVGTSDLDFCTRVIKGDYITKAGYPEIGKQEYPFLIDTNIACMHIDPDGTQFPMQGIQQWCAERGMV